MINKIINIQNKIKTLIQVNNDDYVSYFWKKNSFFNILKFDSINYFRKIRIRYWHKKATNYKPFLPFFNKDALNIAHQDISLPLEVRDIYKTGSTVMDNILTQTEIDQINNFANSIRLKSEKSHVEVPLPQSLEDVRKKLLNKLHPIHNHFFPKPTIKKRLSKIYIGIRIDFSFDGIDHSPQTANWHVDRFLPTVNAIYFPNGANWGEFEKDVGNPLITNEDIKYYINDRRKNNKIPENIRDDLYVQMKCRNKKKFTMTNNTMYIGTHHLQHRRSPYNTPGKRLAIFIDHYNFFSKKDLF
jgi:hypothetical protein